MYLTKRDPIYNIFNEMFRSPFVSGGSDTAGTTKLMKTDIKELENGYTLDVDLPGFSKENIQAELKDGYLTITGRQDTSDEEKDDKGNVVFTERHSGECRRTYYVGEHLDEDDIKAAFEDGVLKLDFPSKEKKPQIEEKKLISIM